MNLSNFKLKNKKSLFFSNISLFHFIRHTFHSRKPFDYIIENQRVRISSEMDQFPFENNQELMDLIPDQGGQPIRAMVI